MSIALEYLAYAAAFYVVVAAIRGQGIKLNIGASKILSLVIHRRFGTSDDEGGDDNPPSSVFR